MLHDKADLVGLVMLAANNIRGFNHRSRVDLLADGCLPAPDAYRFVGSAAEPAYGLPQAFTQLAAGLHRSLTVFDVDDRDRITVAEMSFGRKAHNLGTAG